MALNQATPVAVVTATPVAVGSAPLPPTNLKPSTGTESWGIGLCDCFGGKDTCSCNGCIQNCCCGMCVYSSAVALGLHDRSLFGLSDLDEQMRCLAVCGGLCCEVVPCQCLAIRAIGKPRGRCQSHARPVSLTPHLRPPALFLSQSASRQPRSTGSRRISCAPRASLAGAAAVQTDRFRTRSWRARSSSTAVRRWSASEMWRTHDEGVPRVALSAVKQHWRLSAPCGVVRATGDEGSWDRSRPRAHCSTVMRVKVIIHTQL